VKKRNEGGRKIYRGNGGREGSKSRGGEGIKGKK
jgi:hypothetical protein